MAFELPSRAGGASIDAALFGISADLTYNIFSATNSSPQTTELFSAQRRETLWKYVRLGALQTALLVGVMSVRAAASGGLARAVWPAAGGAMAGGFMWAMYAHAAAAGGGKQ